MTGAYNHFREEEARLKSMEVWPVPSHYAATPDKLAKAGFFKAVTEQFQDRCVCFCCGIALVRWEPADDPWCVTTAGLPSFLALTDVGLSTRSIPSTAHSHLEQT